MESTRKHMLHFWLKYVFPSAGNEQNQEFCLGDKFWNVYLSYWSAWCLVLMWTLSNNNNKNSILMLP